MPMRMSGLMTGMDTESIVAELMSAQSLKKNKVVQAKTKLEWKKNAWSDLNKKLTSLYNGAVSKMRLASSYNLKKATVSDASKATVRAGTSAITGNYTMTVDKIASAQFLTSAETKITSTNQKLSELDDQKSLVGKEITVKGPSGEQKLEITEDTKVSDLLNTFKNAGLNASYDTTQKKFFISSKNTGAENAFSISTSEVSKAETSARDTVKSQIGYDSLSSANKSLVDKALKSLADGSVTAEEATGNIAQIVYDDRDSKSTEAASNLVKSQLYDSHYSDALDEARADKDIIAQFYEVDENGDVKLNEQGEKIPKQGTNADLPTDYDNAVKKKADELSIAYANEHISDADNQATVENYRQNGVKETDIAKTINSETNEEELSAGAKAFGVEKSEGLQNQTVDSLKTAFTSAVEAYGQVDERSVSGSGGAIQSLLGLRAISTTDEDMTYDDGMALIQAKDSEITLNGAKLKSSTSTVSANGLDIDLVAKTEGQPISFSVTNDIDAVYDSIKSALKDYNELMKEMNTLYNADSSKGYEPLTSEEKKALSDDEVEEWEKKIKDSLLRRDSTLQGIVSSMRDAMMSTTNVNGKMYSLSSFGIMTSTNYTEGGLLHIYGDPDDDVYSGEDDRLKKALIENPEDTISALSNVFEKLRTTMFNKMRATEYSSGLTFYNDKQMDTELSNYKTDIKNWEDKLASMEDAYYKKFTAMETAMAKLQSQTASVSGLLGM